MSTSIYMVYDYSIDHFGRLRRDKYNVLLCSEGTLYGQFWNNGLYITRADVVMFQYCVRKMKIVLSGDRSKVAAKLYGTGSSSSTDSLGLSPRVS